MAERWVELADKDGSFYDPQTGFAIPRGKPVRLTNPIGRLTATKFAGRGLWIAKKRPGNPLLARSRIPGPLRQELQ